MRAQAAAFALAFSRPRGGENSATPLESTPRIGHVVRRYRWGDWRVEKKDSLFTAARRKGLRRRSGLGFQYEAVKREAQAPQEEQRRQVTNDGGLNGDGNLQRFRITGCKVIDHAREQHIQ